MSGPTINLAIRPTSDLSNFAGALACLKLMMDKASNLTDCMWVVSICREAV